MCQKQIPIQLPQVSFRVLHGYLYTEADYVPEFCFLYWKLFVGSRLCSKCLKIIVSVGFNIGLIMTEGGWVPNAVGWFLGIVQNCVHKSRQRAWDFKKDCFFRKIDWVPNASKSDWAPGLI